MLSSMTGYGAAQAHVDGVTYRAEIRSVNNRYYKSAMRLPEAFARFENELDKQLRTRLGRGSVIFNLRVRDDEGPAAAQINEPALRRYVERLQQIAGPLDSARIDLASLLEMPGVCESPDPDDSQLEARFRSVCAVVDQAIDKLLAMRRVEGEALAKDLAAQCAQVRSNVADITRRAPAIVQEYQARLLARLQQLVADSSVELDQDAIIREVAIFAERCDINEELARLASHLDQFAEICAAGQEAGRKLDFLAQEMLREANTIGSKAADATVSRHIVEIKTAIDRMKEQVQNVA
jgi:uncharacterized protein (TIGR00255 family)